VEGEESHHREAKSSIHTTGSGLQAAARVEGKVEREESHHGETGSSHHATGSDLHALGLGVEGRSVVVGRLDLASAPLDPAST
jgi:hypothetical protein